MPYCYATRAEAVEAAGIDFGDKVRRAPNGDDVWGWDDPAPVPAKREAHKVTGRVVLEIGPDDCGIVARADARFMANRLKCSVVIYRQVGAGGMREVLATVDPGEKDAKAPTGPTPLQKLIFGLCSRPDGATAAELNAAVKAHNPDLKSHPSYSTLVPAAAAAVGGTWRVAGRLNAEKTRLLTEYHIDVEAAESSPELAEAAD